MEMKDDYRPSKFCNPSHEDNKAEQVKSNSNQVYVQRKSNWIHKDLKLITRLTLIVAAVITIIVASSIIMTPTDYNKKVEKAIEKYQSEFGNIISTSGIGESTEENHYVIFERGGTIFYDGLERGVPVKAIMPRGEGFVFKQVIPAFQDGKPTISYKLLNDGKKSIIRLGIKASSGSLITKRTEVKTNVLNGDKAICIEDIVSNENEDGARATTSYYYSILNPDTVYVFQGHVTHTNEDSYCEQEFSFLDVVGDDEDGRWSPYSFGDYRFTVRVKFPNSDVRLLKFDNNIYINEEDYPMALIMDRLNYSIGKEDGCLPLAWFYKNGKKEAVLNCLEQDMRRKTIEANTFTLTQLSDAYYKKELYEGKGFYLVTEAESINRAYFSDYQYVIKGTKGLGLETETYIYTNDESFANLDYPVIIKAKVIYGRTYGERKSLLVPLSTRIFELYDAELIAWGNR